MIILSCEKPKCKAIKSAQGESKSDNKNKVWILNEFILLDNLRSDDAPACNSDECNLNALNIYEGQILKAL